MCGVSMDGWIRARNLDPLGISPHWVRAWVKCKKATVDLQKDDSFTGLPSNNQRLTRFCGTFKEKTAKPFAKSIFKMIIIVRHKLCIEKVSSYRKVHVIIHFKCQGQLCHKIWSWMNDKSTKFLKDCISYIFVEQILMSFIK